MTPERGNVELGVGFAAMCAARLAMAASAALTAWGISEAIQGYMAQPETHGRYTSSDPGYVYEQTAATERVWDGVGKVGAGGIYFLLSLAADTCILDRRSRKSN